LVYVCLLGLEFELKVLCLQSRHSPTRAIPPAHFALVILEMVALKLFVWAGPQTVILLISASQVAKIIGVTHWHLAPSSFLFAHQPRYPKSHPLFCLRLGELRLWETFSVWVAKLRQEPRTKLYSRSSFCFWTHIIVHITSVNALMKTLCKAHS
jgi:hypothetical protein